MKFFGIETSELDCSSNIIQILKNCIQLEIIATEYIELYLNIQKWTIDVNSSDVIIHLAIWRTYILKKSI